MQEVFRKITKESSGTWSLLGTELDAPLMTPGALRLYFTNNGCVTGTTRFLTNVMGLWILQCCRHSWTARGQYYDDSALMELAAREDSFQCLVDPDHASFLRPVDMLDAIVQFCVSTHHSPLRNPGSYVRAIVERLAVKYSLVLNSLGQLVGRRIKRIRAIGGGSRNYVLNQLTADATGRKVLAGPVEATALGNAGVQLLASGAVTSLKEVRNIIDRSYPAQLFEPLDTARWNRHAKRFGRYCEGVYA
jgi:rhamnulokinase